VVIPLEFRWDRWQPKARVPRLSYGVVCVILCLAVLVQCRPLVTEWRTDGHTTTAYPRQRRAVKTLHLVSLTLFFLIIYNQVSRVSSSISCTSVAVMQQLAFVVGLWIIVRISHCRRIQYDHCGVSAAAWRMISYYNVNKILRINSFLHSPDNSNM